MTGESRYQLAARIRSMLTEQPLSMYDVLVRLREQDYRTVLQAWGDLRTQATLKPDERGRYSLQASNSRE